MFKFLNGWFSMDELEKQKKQKLVQKEYTNIQYFKFNRMLLQNFYTIFSHILLFHNILSIYFLFWQIKLARNVFFLTCSLIDVYHRLNSTVYDVYKYMYCIAGIFMGVARVKTISLMVGAYFVCKRKHLNLLGRIGKDKNILFF